MNSNYDDEGWRDLFGQGAQYRQAVEFDGGGDVLEESLQRAK